MRVAGEAGLESDKLVERIEHDGAVLAIIVRREFAEPGIHFFTPIEVSQQLAFMRHPAGKKIDAHIHNRAMRTVSSRQETLFIRRGRLRVDFYDDHQTYLQSRELRAGDVILLIRGGHGFEVLEDLEMFEVREGPYGGDGDKTRFDGRPGCLPAV